MRGRPAGPWRRRRPATLGDTVLTGLSVVLVAVLVAAGIVLAKWATSDGDDDVATAAPIVPPTRTAAAARPSTTPTAATPTTPPAPSTSAPSSRPVPTTSAAARVRSHRDLTRAPATRPVARARKPPAPRRKSAPKPHRSARKQSAGAPYRLPDLKRKRPPAKTITMAFTGDMLGHTRILAQARTDAGGDGYRFGPMLAGVAPVIRSVDWAVCHQETTIAAPGDSGVQGYPDFRAPHELAAAERAAGWDACDTASNHTTDHGQSGVDATIRALDRAGIRHTGSYAGPRTADTLTVYQVNGVLIGHIAVTYGLNGGTPPHPWTVNLIDIKRIWAEAREMKQHGVDIVVVSIHDGIEQDQQPSWNEITDDHEIMRSPDVDLVVGAHAHVVQPIKELADGRYIVYGLGNLLAWQSSASDTEAPPNRDGIIVMPTFTRDRHGKYHVTRMGYVPTFVRSDGSRVVIAPARSRERVRHIVTRYGASVTDLTDRYEV